MSWWLIGLSLYVVACFLVLYATCKVAGDADARMIGRRDE